MRFRWSFIRRLNFLRGAKDPSQLGRRGEDIACRFLKKEKYKIVERGYCSPYGEIDIIAYDKKVLVFVEVKTRRSLEFGLPEESVSWRKQQRIGRISQHYLQHHKLQGVDCRYDVVSIDLSAPSKGKVTLIKDAFQLKGRGIRGAQY